MSSRFTEPDHLRLLVLHLLSHSGKHLEELFTVELKLWFCDLHPKRWNGQYAQWNAGDVDIGHVGSTVDMLGRFDSFPLSFGPTGAATATWVTLFLDGAISVVRVCLEDGARVLDGDRTW